MEVFCFLLAKSLFNYWLYMRKRVQPWPSVFTGLIVQKSRSYLTCTATAPYWDAASDLVLSLCLNEAGHEDEMREIRKSSSVLPWVTAADGHAAEEGGAKKGREKEKNPVGFESKENCVCFASVSKSSCDCLKREVSRPSLTFEKVRNRGIGRGMTDRMTCHGAVVWWWARGRGLLSDSYTFKLHSPLTVSSSSSPPHTCFICHL